ncbi:acyltransferase [Salinimonas sp. HHU 13199]|uniref:Acyltransferase n=1 Tax=Salinimonas profundi TaxID=2729140 RepID=A0ABR8LQG3_9ALTE|nr:acyltransferase [Salinimonas profundi]MBD3586647.1 acyltransferase [Salinimonas profundi]
MNQSQQFSVSKERLPGLDLVRVLAVYFIILSHAGFETFRGIGVPFLLALSGFLITNSLLKEINVKKSINTPRFWRNRFLRIAPAYYTFIIAAFILDTVILGDSWENNLLFFAATHTVNYFNALHGHGSGMVAHLWTLSTMEQFYLVYPLLLIGAFKSSRPVTVLITFVALSIGWRMLIYTEIVSFDNKIPWIYNALDTRIDSLLIGSLAAFLLTKKPYASFSLPNWSWLLVMFTAGYGLNLSKSLPDFHYTIGFAFEGSLAIIVMLCIMKLSEAKWLSIVNGKLITNLAKISYPMYLYHPIGLGIGFKLSDNFLFGMLLGTVSILILATISFLVIEKPFMYLRIEHNVKGAFR